MREFGIFNDEGLVEGQFYSTDDAERSRSDQYADDEFAKVQEVCPDHGEQPKDGCEECSDTEEEIDL